jgi:hypothetical protein
MGASGRKINNATLFFPEMRLGARGYLRWRKVIRAFDAKTRTRNAPVDG